MATFSGWREFTACLFLNVIEYNKERDECSRKTHEAIEETIHQVCGASNNVLDSKLHELYTVLDDIG